MNDKMLVFSTVLNISRERERENLILSIQSDKLQLRNFHSFNNYFYFIGFALMFLIAFSSYVSFISEEFTT